MKGKKGITLIALIITVIILLILAGVAIGIAINGGDIFGKASQARETWNIAVAEEETKINDVLSILNVLDTNNENSVTTPTPIPEGITMTLNNTQEIITRNNFATHLGKIVTNYSGAPTTVNEKTVSNTYRLFWIDWDNKYGDGEGTIYLKADPPQNAATYALSLETITESVEPEGSIIRKLNPELFKAGKTPPNVNNGNMRGVRWLLNPNNWEDLKLSSYSSKTNYVVGAPCLEMFIDSYNTHYGLTNETMDTGSRNSSSARTKLEYIYPLDGDTFGYGVGPSNDSNAINGYYCESSTNIIQEDNECLMYYYKDGINSISYWLASPCFKSPDNYVMTVRCGSGGQIYGLQRSKF